MQKFVIIGGGVAGLALAIGLIEKGNTVQIFEKRSFDRDNGLGLLLLPNGVEVLTQMGLMPEILKDVHSIDQFANQFSNGQKLKKEAMLNVFGAKRTHILDVLTNKIPDNVIHFEHEYSHFNFDENGQAKSVTFTNGRTVEGDVFIGADGAHSTIRRSLFPQVGLTNTGVKEIVSIVKSPDLVKKLNSSFVKTECKAGGRAVGILPCSPTEVVWFFQFDEELVDFTQCTPSETRAFLLHQLNSWPSPVKEVLVSSDYSKSYLWNTRDMDALPAYHVNNIGLIGDAAHNFSTFTSQGLNCAIEDAYCLARLFAMQSSPNRVFEEFYQLRKSISQHYLKMGRHLRDQFLEPYTRVLEKQVPLAVS